MAVAGAVELELDVEVAEEGEEIEMLFCGTVVCRS